VLPKGVAERRTARKTLKMDQPAPSDTTMHRLAGLLREVFEDPDLVISPATTAADIDGWDSMTHITLIVGAEHSFGVHFTASEIDGMQDVGALARLIDAKRRGAATP
jgi:acyl carrier protein